MKSKVVRRDEVPVDATPWGTLQWLFGKNLPELGMTVGRVTFKPGEANPGHHHPNCDEILIVMRGRLEHSLPEGGTVLLNEGDAIALPRGKAHQARNIGEDTAEVLVVFNHADRQTVGENP
jgi:quercetin dioxygenase-like cupin family protein